MNKIFVLNKITVFLLLICLLSCKPDLDFKISGYTQKVIVEGYIVNGEYPKVSLSLNVPLSGQLDTNYIQKYIISNAKVTVSDNINSQAVGAKTEILTSTWNTSRFPPHSYYGTELIGEEGKIYYLTVSYGGYTMNAKTSIPFKTSIKEIVAAPTNEYLRNLYVKVEIDSLQKNSFLVYTRMKRDRYYKQSPILNSDFTLVGENTFLIDPNRGKNDPSFSEGGYFRKGDLVDIQFCTIDSTSTLFFKELSIFSSNAGIGSKLFLGEKEALKSNISYPGFGIWCGKATSHYSYIIP